MSTATTVRGRTGERCTVSGRYEFDGYTDGTRSPEPRPEERKIPLAINNIFPPIRSSGKGCHWKLTERI